MYVHLRTHNKLIHTLIKVFRFKVMQVLREKGLHFLCCAVGDVFWHCVGLERLTICFFCCADKVCASFFKIMIVFCYLCFRQGTAGAVCASWRCTAWRRSR